VLSTTIDAARAALALERLPYRRWFFGDSVGFEGLLAADALTGSRCRHDFVRGFLRAWAAEPRPYRLLDFTAPGRILAEIAAEADDPILREEALALGRHLDSRRRARGAAVTFEDSAWCLREPYGGAALGSEERAIMADPGPGIWLDCMHFDAPFYAALDRLEPGAGWAERSTAEIMAYRGLLLDEGTGLYRHFWLERPDKAFVRGWGRGQGWALLGLLDVALACPEGTPNLPEVKSEALRLARAMLPFQRDDGHWWCLAHDTRSGPETSTAAFMATAFLRGMRTGLLPSNEFAEPARQALAAVQATVDDAATLRGVSAAVYASLVEEHYWHVPLDHVVPWGQGPLLTALAEAAWSRTP
jgi:unsaturated rhamnogalacturonyl hydrolase